MKFQLLASVLIANIASNPIGTFNKSISGGASALNFADGFGSIEASGQDNSVSYESNLLDQEDSLDGLELNHGNNFGSSIDDEYSNFGSSSELSQQDSLEEQNLEYQNDLTDLFTQIEGLNSLLEEGGDNFDLWGTIKSAAKGIWGVAKKVIGA